MNFFTTELKSVHLNRFIRVDIYVLSDWKNRLLGWAYPCLLFNDGQDLEKMDFRKKIQSLFFTGRVKPMLIIGLHAGDRLQEYGTINRPDYLGRGSKAGSYAKFVTQELFPFLRKKYQISKRNGNHRIAGFSLGGLSAFDLAWHYPELFGQVGVFSGSLWWRSSPFNKNHPDKNLIVPEYVSLSKPHKKQRYWFQAGTKDEICDRNGNGIIDAIDDTFILMKALRKNGLKDISYREVEGGTHHTETWAKVMPEFLEWLK